MNRDLIAQDSVAKSEAKVMVREARSEGFSEKVVRTKSRRVKAKGYDLLLE